MTQSHAYWYLRHASISHTTQYSVPGTCEVHAKYLCTAAVSCTPAVRVHVAKGTKTSNATTYDA